MNSLLIFSSVLAIIAVVSVAANRANYCQLSCYDYETEMSMEHIACNHDNLFNVSCRHSAHMITMTDELKNILIDNHNKMRNFIAGGGDKNYDPACNMSVMAWDDELAEIAALNVKQCKIEHDHCRRTEKFPSAGQNLFIYSSVADYKKFDNAKAVQCGVNGWYGELIYCNRAIMSSFPKQPKHVGYNKEQYGHFTVMMADRNTHLGCAAANYTINNQAYFLLACNYAFTNMINEPIYRVCDSPGINCAYGRHQRYNNLCVLP